MNISQNIDDLTNTFSADRAFCDHLFTSRVAQEAARILVYYKWARVFLPHFQDGFMKMTPKHFTSGDIKVAELWTATLVGGIIKDICLIPYLVLRGVEREAGSVLRRSLEHAGVLTHLWYEPSKIEALKDSDSREFIDAFQSERDQRVVNELKALGVKKRFAKFTFARPASTLYKILSEYGVHGGTPVNLILTPLQSTRFSCGFVNRPETLATSQLSLLADGCEMICCEVASLYGSFGKQYGVTPTEVGEGGRALTNLLSTPTSPSSEMQRQIEEILSQFRQGEKPSA